MKNNDIAVIMHSDLFQGVGEKETESMLGCLSAERRAYEKGAYIYQYGDMVDAIGLVTEGTANVINEDYWGNRNIVAVIQQHFILKQDEHELEEIASEPHKPAKKATQKAAAKARADKAPEATVTRIVAKDGADKKSKTKKRK